ncbi:hypothetical protein [Halomonas halmophila]|uniref:Lipoprotein n=1 Tax=Halomonas halmophila TaxID=252 RepID=A0A4Y4F3Y2_9GAMM|nr:hypothetical protein [Halomonas halmophila]GED22310.1 hypothetical protein HHA01_12870 [Halomonas halmophila]
MKRMLMVLLVSVLSGCTSVQYNGSPSAIKDVNYPPVGTEVTAYVGDNMVEKGVIYEEKVLYIKQRVDGALYDIPSKIYPQVGFDDKQDFFSATGVIRGAISDPIEALAVGKEQGSQVCVITTLGGSACYDADYERRGRVSETKNSFQQTLIYSGRVGNKINIGYREFSNNTARPAFNNEVEYDLSESKRIGYKGAQIKVLEADNSSITYKVLKNFPD